MRLELVFLPLCLVGCQCLVTVDERGDSGRSDGGGCHSPADCPPGAPCSGGAPLAQVATCTNGVCSFAEAVCPPPDAGPVADAGPVDDAGTCTSPAQCTGTRATTSWCDQFDAGFSCVERTCLWECPAGRTCTIDGGCLSCDGQTACPINCTGAGTYSASVEPGSTCLVWPGTTISFTDVTINRTASAQCHYSAYQAAGVQQLGDIWRLSNNDYLAYFPSFGGWCTGRSANTGLERGIFNCPLCQFVLDGFE